MARSASCTGADYYEILNLPFTGTSSPATGPSKQQIKLAYHKSLLRHHPDKASAVARGDSTLQEPSTTSTTRDSLFTKPENVSTSSRQRPFTIDEITTAYKTLANPSLRAEYDRSLRLDRVKAAEREKTGDVFHTGLEIVDLEDLACDDDDGACCWYRGCRCGDEKGFLVTELELEREAEHGEIVIGCRGCSLWLKILFAVEDG